MNELIEIAWLPLIFVAFSTMLLLGELLVNMRGAFAFFGFVTISFYFYLYVPTISMFMTMALIYVLGLALILIDGKLISDGTLGVLGLILIGLSVSISAPSLTGSLYAMIGLILGIGLALSLLKIFPARSMWAKLTLKDRLTKEKGYSSMNQSYEQLLGQEGITTTDLRPSGMARIDQKEYSVISTGQWIDRGKRVRVIQLDGTKIVVEVMEESNVTLM